MFAGWQYVAVFATSFALAVALTPVMRRVANRNAVVDAPDGVRKLQTQPVPYLGGLAIALSSTGVLVSAAVLHGNPAEDLPLLIGVLLPALALSGVGLIDDMRGLTPLPRFLVQSAAGTVTALALALTGTGAQISSFVPLNFAITVFWVIGVTNALNLLDNTDGVASGSAAIASVALALIAFLNGQFLVSAMSLVLGAACFGFLVWNRFPASIYMGDSGSLFIGFMLAAIAIRVDLTAVSQFQGLAVPLLVLLVPILDTTLVVVSRIRRGFSPFVGGLDHLAHRFQRLHLNVRQTARTLWGLTASTCLAAVVVSQASQPIATIVAATCAVAFGLGLWFALRLPDSGELC